MGQIFYACAYDIEEKTCCTIDADKFHANCYSFSGAVYSMHYLLRQKPYRIMWGGHYVSSEENIARFSSTEDLLGISTYIDERNFPSEPEDSWEKSYHDKVVFVCENSKLWKRINVWDEAKAYFDWERTHSVKYSGFLVNHTKKQAVDLASYLERSKFLVKDEIAAIDPVPVLTETGEGAQMALFEGVSVDSTEGLAGKWCGDLLQIVDETPADYEPINCCFSEIWRSVEYCYDTVGVDKEGFVLKDKGGERLKVAALSVYGKRGPPCYVNVEETEDKINFKTVETDTSSRC